MLSWMVSILNCVWQLRHFGWVLGWRWNRDCQLLLLLFIRFFFVVFFVVAYLATDDLKIGLLSGSYQLIPFFICFFAPGPYFCPLDILFLPSVFLSLVLVRAC